MDGDRRIVVDGEIYSRTLVRARDEPPSALTVMQWLDAESRFAKLLSDQAVEYKNEKSSSSPLIPAFTDTANTAWEYQKEQNGAWETVYTLTFGDDSDRIGAFEVLSAWLAGIASKVKAESTSFEERRREAMRNAQDGSLAAWKG